MLELSPIDIDEVTQFLYQTRRVYFEDLPLQLQAYVWDFVKDTIKEYDRSFMSYNLAEILDKKLAWFNEHQAHYFDQPYYKVKLCGVINSGASLDFNAWVEYRGLTPLEFHTLPSLIRNYYSYDNT
jgi:hypothetical protein